jgi:hypothetical protein
MVFVQSADVFAEALVMATEDMGTELNRDKSK